MSVEVQIFLAACLVGVTCCLPGVFLVLRKMCLMSESISHSILLGIVLALFVVKDLDSIFLIIGAALMGVFSVSLSGVLMQNRLIKKDAAISLVFPVLFSIAVILINSFLRDAHVDTECILYGEIAYTPFERFIFDGVDLGPRVFWSVGIVGIFNFIVILVMYRRLKVSSFDQLFATSLGFSPIIINYIFMFMVSISTVVSFESVGVILIVALMIVPPSAAYLLTQSVSKMIIVSVTLSLLAVFLGFFIALQLNINIAGSIATANGIIFVLALVFSPKGGLLKVYLLRKKKTLEISLHTLIIHLFNHRDNCPDKSEFVVEHMKKHMLWKEFFTQKIIEMALDEGFIDKKNNLLSLTGLGEKKAENILYNL